MAEGSVVFEPPTGPFALRVEFDKGRSGVQINKDGTLHPWGDYTPDRAAEVFWESMANFWSKTHSLEVGGGENT